MKTIIIDDEPLAIELVKEFIADFPQLKLVDTCANGFEGIRAIKEHQPDLVFLDVQMPKIDGFEMLELIEESPYIIFTTAFDQYALKAFELNAVDYLLKPLSKERFGAAVNKFILQHNTEQELNRLHEMEKLWTREKIQKILVKTAQDILMISPDDIAYIESYDDYVKIYTQEKVYIKKDTLQRLEECLNDSGFIRIHRTYLVNKAYIHSIVKNPERETPDLELSNGIMLNMSRNGHKNLKEKAGLA